MAPLSIFPPELWLMIFQYLREESPQHISRLAQTCKSFIKNFNHIIYQPVRLKQVENAHRFAITVSSRPDLAALVKEGRHAGDVGFSDFTGYSEPFYKALTKLPNLETLVMRESLRRNNEYTSQTALEAALTAMYYHSRDSYVPELCLQDLVIDMGERGYPLGDPLDQFGLGFDPWEEDFSLQGWAENLVEHTYFSRDNLKDLIPALRTYYGLNFDSFDVLKEIIITPPSMLALGDEDMTLPGSLQRLTIRYEEGTDGKLPSLRSGIYQIPDNICEVTASSDVRVEAAAFKSKFKNFGLELSTELVLYPLTMPKYDVCPCENLTFYHQFPFHPHVETYPQNEQATNTIAAN
ncbi:hypothetical protein N7449_010086 [Penicillium cf. viridicatum]|uniref:F-box domain-containing protein n=1 Tax=Penicillium cf. viridicatum TaxID=2972119 RepID=A0A9W9IZW9_9EURO|nr:hypothetical protein N7449_010086 [Penicillium cf. viridicatum]